MPAATRVSIQFHMVSYCSAIKGDLLNAKMSKCYYSVGIIARALRMLHDTEHEKVAEQHI